MLEAIRTFAAFAPKHLRMVHITLLNAEVLAAWMTGLIALDADAVVS